MKLKTVVPIALTGLLLATSVTYGAGYVSIIKTNIDNTNNPYSIEIRPRETTCAIGTFGGVVAQSDSNATLYSAVSAAATSSGKAFLDTTFIPFALMTGHAPGMGLSSIKSCTTTYYVYAQTQGGSQLIGIMNLKYDYQHLPKQTSNRAICHFLTGGSYLDKQNKNIPGDISASIQGVSQCGANGAVTFNFN